MNMHDLNVITICTNSAGIILMSWGWRMKSCGHWRNPLIRIWEELKGYHGTLLQMEKNTGQVIIRKEKPGKRGGPWWKVGRRG
jgi:hypothetical protein